MELYQDNSQRYRPSIAERSRTDEAYQVFTAVVMTVDYERKVLTIQDDRSGLVYTEVRVWPALASSVESTDVEMPEQGTHCAAANLYYTAGYSKVIVVAWLTSNTLGAMDAVASSGPVGIEGWMQRRRGTYRKAYPGQKTMTTTSGFSEKIDEGWDYLASDFSRDKLDSFRRERTQITSRNVNYSDAGLSFEGPVNRNGTGLSNYQAVTLPDGTPQWVLYLNSAVAQSSRYLNGTPDVIALTEKVEKTQELALDYPVSEEVLETSLLDFILGTTKALATQTTVLEANTPINGQTVQVGYDNESFMINQSWDNPQAQNPPASAVGPTTREGTTPARRGFIIEEAKGTLVGSNLFDKVTYGLPLVPVLNPATYMGRFGADFESGYLPVPSNQDSNFTWTRMATSACSVRFPYEYNTTRWDITKEGMLLFEVGAGIPQTNNPFGSAYEYVHGPGRSVEGHLVGSLKLVVGKNLDEEDAIDLQALGQSVLRFGADDCSLPNQGRSVLTQNRADNDAVEKRQLQYWAQPLLMGLGDPGSLTNKTHGENVSIRGSMDGGLVMRFGARTPLALRRHLINGYQDAQGLTYLPPGNPSRVDSKSPGRPTYGAGDPLYRFHDLTQAGNPPANSPLPYAWSGTPVNSMDQQGLSIDFHTVRDILIRAGKDTDHGQSLLMDLAGGLVAWLGADTSGRSITATLDGGVEMVVGVNNQGKSIRLCLQGDLDLTVNGNMHLNVTGDIVQECNAFRNIVHTDVITTGQKIIDAALVRHTTEAPDIVHNQGLYVSNANS
jgi:hypothetical protein